MFLCNIYGCKCQTLHDYCPLYTLQAHTMTLCPWPSFYTLVTSSYINKVHLLAEMIDASIKPRHMYQVHTMTWYTKPTLHTHDL